MPDSGIIPLEMTHRETTGDNNNNKRQRRELEIRLTREWPQLYTGQYAVQDRTHDVYAGRAPARCCGRLHTYLGQNSLDLFSRRPANETTTCKLCGSWTKGRERRIKLVIFGASRRWQRVRFGVGTDPHRGNHELGKEE